MMTDAAADKMMLVCNRCNHSYIFQPPLAVGRCPNCSTVNVETSPAGSSSLAAELVAPFKLQNQAVQMQIEKFAAGIPFHPQDLTAANLVTRMQKVYLPAYLVDVDISAGWSAEVGFDYQVVSHQDQFSENQGGWSSREVKEGRIRWEPRQGRLKRSFHNLAAPAVEGSGRGMPGNLDVNTGRTCLPEDLDGCLVQIPARDPQDAWNDAIPAAQLRAAGECRDASGAGHIRQFQWTPEFSNQNWTLFLSPVYMSFYLDDDNQPQPVRIHGQTGQISGARRASMKQAQRASLVILVVAVVLFMLGILASGAGMILPPLLALGAGLMLVSVIVAVCAVIPPGMVWQFNRSNSRVTGG